MYHPLVVYFFAMFIVADAEYTVEQTFVTPECNVALEALVAMGED